MHRSEKERLVAELTERLKGTDTLIVADYRGLTNKQLEALRDVLLEQPRDPDAVLTSPGTWLMRPALTRRQVNPSS